MTDNSFLQDINSIFLTCFGEIFNNIKTWLITHKEILIFS